MLGSILTKEKCMNCKNCCVFYSDSRWEMPEVPEQNADKICEFLNNKNAISKTDEGYKMQSVLREKDINNKSEEYRCAALDENKGCTLPDDLKPIECSMWPVRVMEDAGKVYITLASSCHGADSEFKDNLLILLNESLKEKIIDIVKKNKSIIKKYDSSYLKLMEITGEVNE